MFYPSFQATAANVQINNINLIRGMIGRPGSAILQFNGQPRLQNTRETGCDGEYAGFCNWQDLAGNGAVISLVVEIVIVAIAGEAVRQSRLFQPGQK